MVKKLLYIIIFFLFSLNVNAMNIKDLPNRVSLKEGAKNSLQENNKAAIPIIFFLVVACVFFVLSLSQCDNKKK